MTKYLITSNKFTGEAEVYYNRQGLLCRIDLVNCEMMEDVVKGFKSALPALISSIPSFSENPSILKVVQVGYRITFDEFWNAYKKKINKDRCIPLYNRLSDADTIDCFNGIKVYDQFLAGVKGRQKLDPENYLKLRSWQNQWM